MPEKPRLVWKQEISWPGFIGACLLREQNRTLERDFKNSETFLARLFLGSWFESPASPAAALRPDSSLLKNRMHPPGIHAKGLK